MNTYSLKCIAVIALMGGLCAACDNPVENHDDEHPGEEADGLILLSGGQELVRVEGGQVADTLFVPFDGSVDIELEFLDEDGQTFHADDLEEGLTLAWEIRGEAIISVQSTGTWSFSVQGDEAGETAMRILLMHGDPPHVDFTTPDITVTVE